MRLMLFIRPSARVFSNPFMRPAWLLNYHQQKVVVDTQVALPVIFEGLQVETGLWLDLLASNLVIIELKSVETIIPLYEAQLLTYLKVTGLRLGYLINFNVVHLKDGIKRMVN